eukprot:1118670-Rhodomonas_salina.1
MLPEPCSERRFSLKSRYSSASHPRSSRERMSAPAGPIALPCNSRCRSTLHPPSTPSRLDIPQSLICVVLRSRRVSAEHPRNSFPAG